MTATIAIELGEVPYNTTHYYALFVIGLVLFIMTFVVNLISATSSCKRIRRWSGGAKNSRNAWVLRSSLFRRFWFSYSSG